MSSNNPLDNCLVRSDEHDGNPVSWKTKKGEWLPLGNTHIHAARLAELVNQVASCPEGQSFSLGSMGTYSRQNGALHISIQGELGTYDKPILSRLAAKAGEQEKTSVSIAIKDTEGEYTIDVPVGCAEDFVDKKIARKTSMRRLEQPQIKAEGTQILHELMLRLPSDSQFSKISDPQTANPDSNFVLKVPAKDVADPAALRKDILAILRDRTGDNMPAGSTPLPEAQVSSFRKVGGVYTANITEPMYLAASAALYQAMDVYTAPSKAI